jgi:small subunit ribosomal protein S4e
MARGPRKHLKRLAAPKHWMLDKLSGRYAPRPSSGPHKLRECMPLVILIRNRLKYALTRQECVSIVNAREIKVDQKVRTDLTYPAGFMDVISIDKTNENFRLLYDVRGRFTLKRIPKEEAGFKICKVRAQYVTKNKVPVITTHDARTIRFPDPVIKVNDSVKVDLATGKVVEIVKFESGNLVMLTGGKNQGRVGIIERRERHPESFDIVHIKDAAGHAFATRIGNVFAIGQGTKSMVTLPKRKGIKQSPLEDRVRRLAKSTA